MTTAISLRAVAVFLFVVLCACTAQSEAPTADETIDTPETKLDSELAGLYAQFVASGSGGSEEVLVDATATATAERLAADLKSLGAQNVSAYGRVASARVRVELLYEISTLESLQFCRLSQAATK